MVSFEWNQQGLRDLERKIERGVEQQAAPIFAALNSDLSALGQTHREKDRPVIRAAVEQVFRRHRLAPANVQAVVEAIHSGKQPPRFEGRSAPVRLNLP